MRDNGERETAGRGIENGRPRLPRVLVAEDERDVAELIRHHLTKDGYDAMLAKTGTEALERARREKPDLILLDIMIPEMNGWEVCRCLKREPETSGIPVIKPFSPRELLARVRAVARRRQGGEATARRSHLKAGLLEIDRERFEVTVDVHMARLRAKFLDAKVELPDVETVRGVGYRFREADAARL